MMIAEIIAVGSEMLTPFKQDTNSLYLTAGLNDLGVVVAFKTIVGDSLHQLTEVARNALERADIIIFSGGLGPTEDDLTREAAATALGLTLHPDPGIITALYKRFAERRITITPNNVKQADILDGAVLLENKNGTAPGQFLATTIQGKKRYIALLPGPPKELKPLFDEQVKPRLQALLPPQFLAKRILRMALIPESQVDARTSPIYSQYDQVETTILAGSGEIQLHFQSVASSAQEAHAQVDEVAERVEREMGDDIFSSQGESLEEVILLMLGMRHQTLATAESCTGGLLAQRLTAVPNSSRAFLGGAVPYSNDLKTSFCNVSADLIAAEGSVSEAVAAALASGIQAATGASFGIGITGLAGPGGGGEGPDSSKPVGLVFIGITDATGPELATQVKHLQLSGDRERIRWWATQHALDLLRRQLL